jgi:hypothetical protein
MQRRQLPGLLGLCLSGYLWPARASAEDDRGALFRITRSKNKNVVVYQANRRGNGLNLGEPIGAHWLMLAEDGRREELTWTERRLAYGFDVQDVALDHCRVTLLACRSRPLLVARGPRGFRALCRIAGEPAVLERIFVRTNESALVPSVSYVDLFGESLQGAPLSERLTAR